MPTLEALRNRIATANDLHGVVRVMKALAAVSIRQYERAVESLAQYSRAVEFGLQVLLRHQPEEAAVSLSLPGKRLGVIVYGSDQGMCGSFNEQVTSFALERAVALAPDPRDRVVMVFGTRAADQLKDAGQSVEEPFATPGSLPAITPTVNKLVMLIEELQTSRGVSRVIVVHNRPQSGAAYQPQMTQLLPLDPTPGLPASGHGCGRADRCRRSRFPVALSFLPSSVSTYLSSCTGHLRNHWRPKTPAGSQPWSRPRRISGTTWTG